MPIDEIDVGLSTTKAEKLDQQDLLSTDRYVG